jgi:hypothetical protein
MNLAIHGLEGDTREGISYYDDLHNATGPSPFHGFAEGAIPPNWAMPRSLLMSSWIGVGKSRKSRFEDPTQCSGFSPEAGARRTGTISHFLGYERTATPEWEGEQCGGTGPPREVFPLARIDGRRRLRSRQACGA